MTPCVQRGALAASEHPGTIPLLLSCWDTTGHGTAFKTKWMNDALYEVAGDATSHSLFLPLP
jgi:hypothetical protein